MENHNLLNRFYMLDADELGECPNLYICGKSFSLLEKVAEELTSIITQNKVIEFKGMVTSFSIFMPYYDNIKKAVQFMNKLMESYSIARDCYDLYKGIIVIECDEEWSKFGYNSSLELLTSFIEEHKEICFLFLMPVRNEMNHSNALFAEFTKSRLWIRYECEETDTSDCVSLFCDEAVARGYLVTEDAKFKLVTYLKERNEFFIDNKTTVLHLIKQIQLNKMLQSGRNNQICESDIDFVSGMSDRTKNVGIGFNYKIR